MKGKPLGLRIADPLSAASGRIGLSALLLLALAVGLAVALAILAYEFGSQSKGSEDDKAREQIGLLRLEVDRLNGMLESADSLRSIERATQEQLLEQIKSLESENTRLKEELSFYERLLPAKPGKEAVAIRRFAAELVPPNQLRYRLLILARNDKEKTGFTGKAQLIVTAYQNERQISIVFPQPQSPEEQNFSLNFRHYQRIEGMLNLPEGAIVHSVHARILQDNQIRVQQTIKF